MGYDLAYSSGHPFQLSKPRVKPAAVSAIDLGR